MYDATNAVILKPGREVHARNRHPWVFLGAVASFPQFENGDILPVVDAGNNFLGYGYFNQGQSIVGRMISFTEGNPQEAMRTSIQNALTLRQQIIQPGTTAYRLINGEGDFLPGLIVDVYGPALVLQINTLGMEKLKPAILAALQEAFPSSAVYEKSSTSTRKKEGLAEANTWLVGKLGMPVTIMENNIQPAIVMADDSGPTYSRFAVPTVVSDVCAVPNATSSASVVDTATPAKPNTTLPAAVVSCDKCGANVTVPRFQLFGNATENCANSCVVVSKSRDFVIFLFVVCSVVPAAAPFVVREIIAEAGIQMVSLPVFFITTPSTATMPAADRVSVVSEAAPSSIEPQVKAFDVPSESVPLRSKFPDE